MDIIKTIFSMHDEAQQITVPSARSRFGSHWQLEDGIILYPANGTARDFIVLLKATLPQVPLLLCDDLENTMKELSGLQLNTIEEAVKCLPKALFVLCSTGDNASRQFAAIAPKLSPARFNNVITSRQLGEFLPVGDKTSKSFDVYRKTFLAASRRNREKVEAAFSLFKDPLSQAVFSAVLKRYLLSSDALIPVSTSDEYFEDVYTLLPDEIFVDCGGFSGDTLLKYLQVAGNCALKGYHVFEPDPNNFKQLICTVEKLPELVRNKVQLYPNAVGHEQDTLYFDAAGNVGSVVNPNGTTPVECVTLDEALHDIHPTLIKFDIEGYEAFALQGGKQIIKENRPVLALCVYHHPFDLWELPLMVRNMVKDYHFFLRAYLEQFSYTCYCVPSERLPHHLKEGRAIK